MIVADVTYFEPWWMQIAKSLVIFFVVFNLIPVTLLAERKLLGRFQGRYGPNRVGPFGALQPIADILKLVGKEDFRPRTAQALLYTIAPVLSVDDVLEAIGVVAAKPERPEPAGDAGRVLAIVRDTPATVDEIARVLELPAAEVAVLLTRLELEGLVEMGEGVYRATIAA